MRKLLPFTVFTVILSLISGIGYSQLLTDDFTFSGNLSANGWVAHSGAGTSVIATTTGLAFTGYPADGTTNAALVKNTGGEDVNKRFTTQNTNGQSIYCAFLVNVNEASTSKSGDYFLHLGNASADGLSFTNFSARVFARVVSGNVNFGLSNSATATYGTTNFARNTTYLLVVKYTINNTGNDITSLYVFSAGNTITESATPEITNSLTAGQDAINAIGLRQGTTSQPQTVVDGIRISNTFTEATGGSNQVNLSVSTNSASEAAATTVTVTATAAQAVSGNQTVTLNVSGVSTADYTLNGLTQNSVVITIPNGSKTGTATFVVVDDAIPEGSETATLSLSNYSSGIAAGLTTTLNIIIADNDAATVSIAAGSNGSEAPSSGTFTINFIPATIASTDINFAYTGSATFGTDYSVSYSSGSTVSTTSSGTLTVPAGTSSVTVTITPVDDELIEGTENVSATLSSPTQDYVIGTSNASINITDNDFPKNVSVSAGNNLSEPSTNGAFNISLTSPAPAGGVTIHYTFDGTGTQGADYTDPQSGTVTIPQGSSSAVINLNVSDDAVFESTETINILLTSATNGYTITGPTASVNISDNEVILFNGSYAENFNSLANTGSNNSWSNNVTVNGWYSSRSSYNAANGGSNSGALYSFGSDGSTDRALGSVGSGSTGTVFYGIRLKNNTGATITNLQVSYTGEQWRNGGNTNAQTVNFAYLTGTTVTSLSASGWIPVSSLNFTSPVTGSSASALNGNLPENSNNILFNITGLNIPPGNEIMLRWEDIDHSGNDHGLAIDDVLVTNVVCSTPTANATGLTFDNVEETTLHGSFTASTPASDKYLIIMSTASSLTSNPVNGQVYETGDNVGDGSVIGYSASTDFSATGLSGSTTYYFFIFPANSACIGGPNYLTTDPLTGSVTTDAGLPSCSAPAEQASNFVITNTSINSLQATFTPAAVNEYLVLRSTESSLSTLPVNGQVYNAGNVLGNATVVQRGAAASFTASGLAPETQYYFFVFSLNSQQCLNGPAYNTVAPLSGQGTTLPLPACSTPVNQPNTLGLNSTNDKVSGTFNAASGADAYLVIRSTSPSLSALPVDNTDYNIGDNIGGGTVVSNDATTSFSATGLSQSSTYYIFIFSANKNCTGGTKYLTVAPLTGSITTTATPPNYVYFGTLHSHSDYSDGNKDRPGYTPAQDYQYAKDAECMDFLGISEHNHFSSPDNPGNLITNYHQGTVQANNFNAANPGFLALYGMEWGVISGGGHVVIYGDGMDKLFGWESNVGGLTGPNYDVYVPKSVYTGPTGLFKTVNDFSASNTFATLAHPNNTDFNNISNIAYDGVADDAIVGTAVESGPSTSSNTTYSNPGSPMFYRWYFDKMLSKGYHLGPTIDHDNHNTTFGKTTRSRTAVIAPALTQTELIKAMRNMHFYATEDCDAKVDFTINTKIMGSVFEDRNAPNISVTLTDPTTNTNNALIRVKFGIPGSGILPVTIDSVYGNTLNFTDNNLAINATGYYYIDITNSTGEIITSPIWYTRLCVNTSVSSKVACENYTWPSNGVSYNESGTYIHSYTDQGGCSNTDTLHLTITHPSAGDTTVIACDSFTWYGVTYNESGTPSKVLTGFGGCDSTVTLHLTINRSTISTTDVTACNSYSWNGKEYTTSGQYTFHSTNAAGCDSTAILNVIINNSSSSVTNVTACDSYTWNGNTYSTSGSYTYQTANAAGCDSTATLVLTINHSSSSTSAITACDSYTWNGHTYSTSGNYTYQTTNAAGCDSTATLDLTINHSSSSTTAVTACDSYTWNGHTYSTSGNYTYQTTNAAGCDSTATLVLTINHSSTTDETVTACGSYSWHGTVYSSSGTYTFLSENASHCTNTATLYLTVNPLPVVNISNASVLNQGVFINTVYTGYAPASVLSVSAVAGAGTAGYSYSWSAGNGLDIVSGANQSTVKVSAANTGNYSATLMVTVTDSKGCTATKSVTIYVKDIRSGMKNDKVTVCHNGSNISVDANAVNAHLSHGDILGSCSSIITSARSSSVEIARNTQSLSSFMVKVSPNPSASDFRIRVQTSNLSTVYTRLMNITGSVILKKTILPDETLVLGKNLRSGTYLLEIRQGDQIRIVRLIKL